MELFPRLSALSSLAEMVETFGEANGIPDNQIFLVNLEIDELMTNYVMYSVRKVKHPRMGMTLEAFEGRLVLTVEDSGPPFNPLEAPAPNLQAAPDEREAGGVGLHLVRTYSDRMSYECVDGCNRLVIEHDLAPAGAVQPAEETC